MILIFGIISFLLSQWPLKENSKSELSYIAGILLFVGSFSISYYVYLNHSVNNPASFLPFLVLFFYCQKKIKLNTREILAIFSVYFVLLSGVNFYLLVLYTLILLFYELNKIQNFSFFILISLACYFMAPAYVVIPLTMFVLMLYSKSYINHQSLLPTVSVYLALFLSGYLDGYSLQNKDLILSLVGLWLIFLQFKKVTSIEKTQLFYCFLVGVSMQAYELLIFIVILDPIAKNIELLKQWKYVRFLEIIFPLSLAFILLSVDWSNYSSYFSLVVYTFLILVTLASMQRFLKEDKGIRYA